MSLTVKEDFATGYMLVLQSRKFIRDGILLCEDDGVSPLMNVWQRTAITII